MAPTADPIELERAGWAALGHSGTAATDFYAAVLAPEPTFVLPGVGVLVGRDAIITSMGGPPWSQHELADVRTVELGPDAEAVVYRAHARRGDVEYRAFVASTYTHTEHGWRLVLHQQTPA